MQQVFAVTVRAGSGASRRRVNVITLPSVHTLDSARHLWARIREYAYAFDANQFRNSLPLAHLNDYSVTLGDGLPAHSDCNRARRTFSNIRLPGHSDRAVERSCAMSQAPQDLASVKSNGSRKGEIGHHVERASMTALQPRYIRLRLVQSFRDSCLHQLPAFAFVFDKFHQLGAFFVFDHGAVPRCRTSTQPQTRHYDKMSYANKANNTNIFWTALFNKIKGLSNNQQKMAEGIKPCSWVLALQKLGSLVGCFNRMLQRKSQFPERRLCTGRMARPCRRVRTSAASPSFLNAMKMTLSVRPRRRSRAEFHAMRQWAA